MKKRTMRWKEKRSTFYRVFYSINRYPETKEIAFTFISQGLKATDFLQCLAINENSRGRVLLKSEIIAADAGEKRKYFGLTQRDQDIKSVKFGDVVKLAGYTASNRDDFNEDCVNLKFKLNNFYVEFYRHEDIKDMMKWCDLFSITVTAPNKNQSPALYFLFNMLNMPEFAPIIELPKK